MRVESSSCCFPRELGSFVHPRELVRFDQQHVTCSPQLHSHKTNLSSNKFKLCAKGELSSCMYCIKDVPVSQILIVVKL